MFSWLQSPSAVMLEPPKIKFVTVSIVSPSICLEVMGPDSLSTNPQAIWEKKNKHKTTESCLSLRDSLPGAGGSGGNIAPW